MFVKKLTLMGFKSFADKTEFDFEPGLTGLVGPNGCGKSNVVDALKWVLGEQRPTSLRSKEMGDVIFNGTATRKAMGFCEVTLIVDNRSGRLPLDTEEVVISRRVFRDGSSEYLVNKKSVRLKDIRDMLADTGLGVDGYSIIEQGRVDRLLTSNAQERRIIFEEAAGISKYRMKRKETERRLENTKANLLRLDDILEELSKRLATVKRQAAKAQRYREIYEELKQSRSLLTMNDYKAFADKLTGVSATLSELSNKETECRTQVDTLEAKLSSGEKELIDLETQVSQKTAMQHEYSSMITAAEERIRANGESIGRLKAGAGEGEAKLREISTRMEEVAARIAEVKKELVDVDVRYENDLQRATKEETESRDLSDRIRLLQGELDQNREKAFELEKEKSSISNQRQLASGNRDSWASQTERLKYRREQLDKKGKEYADQLAGLENEIEKFESQVRDLEDDLHKTESERVDLEEHIDQLSKQLDLVRETLMTKRSRLEFLQDLKQRLEGLGGGVRAVLSAAPQLTGGIRGLLVDCFRVDMKYAHAMDAALGLEAQSLVASDLDSAMAQIRRLRREDLGRASFILPSAVKAADFKWEGGGEGVLGTAMDLISVDSEYQPLFRHMLRNVLVVETIDHAIKLYPEHSDWTFVTLDGELLSEGSRLSGGSFSEGVNLSHQRAEIQELESVIEKVADECIELTRRKEEARGKIRAVLEKVKNLRSEAHEKNILLMEKNNLKSHLDRERENNQRERLVVTSEMDQLQAQIEQSKQQDGYLESRGGKIGGELATLEQVRVDLRGALAKTEQDLQTRLETLTQAKIDLGKVGEKRSSLRQNLHRFELEHEEKQALLHETRQRMEEEDGLRRKLETEIQAKEKEIEEHLLEKSALDEVLLGLRNRRDGLRAEIGQWRESVRELHDDRRSVEDDLGKLRIQESELNIKIENLKLRMFEDYQIDMDKAIETYNPEDVQNTDWETLRAKIEDLKKSLNNLGNVNLDSLDELGELEQRHGFLDGQKKDLTDAQASLEQVIAEIDETCKKRFDETFKIVSEHFSNLFRKLFGGGKADLVMAEPENPLESGIDIIARPPGKQPKSLQLLSGGEKVMTTVALLFAIFNAKPSVFCILDEVDAALDESNIDRFLSVLVEYLRDTQFVIITHNKRTMAKTDRLYGVTQQEKGVSKKIVVHFEREPQPA